MQFALIGLDENLNSTSLGQYAPEARSTSENVVVAKIGDEAATRVNVLCVGDGEAWITVEAAGVRADVPVLVGTARRKASPKGPHPELAGAITTPSVARAPAQQETPTNVASESPSPSARITTAPASQPAPTSQTTLPAAPTTQSSPPAGNAPASSSGAAQTGPARVQAQNKNTANSVVDSAAGVGALPAPTGVTAKYLGEGRIALAWNAVPSATVYTMLARNAGTNNWYPLTTQPVTGAPSKALLAVRGRTEASRNFVTNPTTGIAVPAGTVEFVVVPQRDAQEWTGTRSAPVTLNVPRYSGRYRVTVNGFRVNQETLDAPLNYDGQHDEVYVSVAYREYDAEGNPVGPERRAKTKTHGDVNATRWKQPGSATFRYPAGNATMYGGLKTGNGHPTLDAWISSPTASHERFPLLVWEGYLQEGQNSVAIVPVIYEDDENAWELVPETRALSELGAWVGARTYEGVETTLGPATEKYLKRAKAVSARKARVTQISQLVIGFGMAGNMRGSRMVTSAALDLLEFPDRVVGHWSQKLATFQQQNPSFLQTLTATAGLLLNTKDRPIGMTGIDGGKILFEPEVINLSFETAEQILSEKEDPNSNVPAGIVTVRYKDTVAGGNGDYTLYLEVKKLQ